MISPLHEFVISKNKWPNFVIIKLHNSCICQYIYNSTTIYRRCAVANRKKKQVNFEDKRQRGAKRIFACVRCVHVRTRVFMHTCTHLRTYLRSRIIPDFPIWPLSTFRECVPEKKKGSFTLRLHFGRQRIALSLSPL